MNVRDEPRPSPAPGPDPPEARPAGPDAAQQGAGTLSSATRTTLTLLAVVALTYVPVLSATYAFRDDYQGIDDPAGLAAACLRSGRPLLYMALRAMYEHCPTVSSLAAARGLAVGLIGLLAVLLHRAARRAGLTEMLALAFALLAVTMPPFQVYAAWAVEAFHPLAAGLALLAGGLLTRVEGSRKLGLARVGAFALLLAALLLYQPAAMFLWVGAAISLFAPRVGGADETPSHRGLALARRLVAVGLVCAVALACAFVVFKLCVATYGAPAGLRSGVAVEVADKARWFVRSPLVAALNLNSIQPTPMRALLVAGFVATGLWLRSGGPASVRFARLALAALLLPAAYAPNLLTRENWPSYRSQLALATLVVWYAVLALDGWAGALGRRWPVVRRNAMPALFAAGCAVASALIASQRVVALFVEPQSCEYRYVKARLRQRPAERVRPIYLVRSQWSDGVVPLVVADEFGLPSSVSAWVPGPLVRCALRDLGQAGAATIIMLPPERADEVPANAFVLDMRRLREFR